MSAAAEAGLTADACGKSVPVITDAKTFASVPDAERAAKSAGEGWLGQALDAVCAQAELAPAFRAQVTSVVLRQAYGAPDPLVTLVDGALAIDFLWQADAAPDPRVVAAEIGARLRGTAPEPP